MTTGEAQAADWLRRRARIRIHSGAVGGERLVMAEGTVVAWCASPSFTIQHDDGTRSSWSASLPIVEVEKPAPAATPMTAANPLGPYETEADTYTAPMLRELDGLDGGRRLAVVHRHLYGACEQAGVRLGEYDRQVLDWATRWEPHVLQVFIGVVGRAHLAGMEEGGGT